MSPELSALRSEIDSIDDKIVALMGDRREVSEKIGALKLAGNVSLRDTAREYELLSQLVKNGLERNLPPSLTVSVFQAIISDSVQRQSAYIASKTEPHTIQSLGHIGFTARELLFTNQAIAQCSGSFPTPGSLSEHPSTAALLEALELGVIDTAFIPLEHSLYGTIRESIQCLQASNASIVNECRVPTAIALMAPPGTELQQIQVVYGSELAFRLCLSLLETLPKARRELATPPRGPCPEGMHWALLAPESYAHENGLAVIASNVSDHGDATLRFVVCAKNERSLDSRVPAKTSLLITCSQESGSLAQILELFTEGNIILTKLESLGKDLHSAAEWIFLECQGIHHTGNLSAVIERLKLQKVLVKVCGSYPRVDTPPRPSLHPREERLR